MNDAPINTKECREIEEHLSPYLDGMLDEETRARVEEHLRVCGECRKALEDLNVLVREMGSLDTVPAPAGLLKDVNKRIQNRSPLRKILHVLFYPSRVKIPIQLAAAATAGLLVFVVFQSMENDLTETPEPLRLEKTERSASDSVGRLARQKAEKKRPSFETARVAEERKEGLIRLALLIEPAEKGLEQGAAGDSPISDRSDRALRERTPALRAPAPEAAGKPAPGIESEALSFRKAPEKGPAPSAGGTSPAPAEEVGEAESLPLYDPFPRLKTVIEEMGGEIRTVEYDQETRRPRSLSLEITLTQLDTLYQELGSIGTQKTFPPAASTGKPGRVQVEIRFLYPE